MARESVGLLAGGRALLMQLAHPLVACGVGAHSDFPADPLGRLERTLNIMLALIAGDRRQAEAALRRFQHAHAPVHGRLPKAAGGFPGGTTYSARDPSLQLWVHATLVDTLLISHERFVAPLSPHERTRFYDDTLRLGRLLGIPPALLPPALGTFHAYVRAMLDGDVLFVTEAARALAPAVLAPPLRVVPRAGAGLARFITAGLLPEQLRAAYGLAWNARGQATLDVLSGASRMLLPLTPASLRYMSETGRAAGIAWALRRRL